MSRPACLVPALVSALVMAALLAGVARSEEEPAAEAAAPSLDSALVAFASEGALVLGLEAGEGRWVPLPESVLEAEAERSLAVRATSGQGYLLRVCEEGTWTCRLTSRGWRAAFTQGLVAREAFNSDGDLLAVDEGDDVWRAGNASNGPGLEWKRVPHPIVFIRRPAATPGEGAAGWRPVAALDEGSCRYVLERASEGPPRHRVRTRTLDACGRVDPRCEPRRMLEFDLEGDWEALRLAWIEPCGSASKILLLASEDQGGESYWRFLFTADGGGVWTNLGEEAWGGRDALLVFPAPAAADEDEGGDAHEDETEGVDEGEDQEDGEDDEDGEDHEDGEDDEDDGEDED